MSTSKQPQSKHASRARALNAGSIGFASGALAVLGWATFAGGGGLNTSLGVCVAVIATGLGFWMRPFVGYRVSFVLTTFLYSVVVLVIWLIEWYLQEFYIQFLSVNFQMAAIFLWSALIHMVLSYRKKNSMRQPTFLVLISAGALFALISGLTFLIKEMDEIIFIAFLTGAPCLLCAALWVYFQQAVDKENDQ